MAHSPGPWTLDSCANGWSLLANGSDVTKEPFDCSDADARLIAAAPDLLAACQAMAHDLRAIQFTDGEYRLSEDAARQMMQFLERVISKATEGTNGKERSLD